METTKLESCMKFLEPPVAVVAPEGQIKTPEPVDDPFKANPGFPKRVHLKLLVDKEEYQTPCLMLSEGTFDYDVVQGIAVDGLASILKLVSERMPRRKPE